MFSLAIKICDHLSIDIEIGRNRILKEWALYKVRQTEYDDEKVFLFFLIFRINFYLKYFSFYLIFKKIDCTRYCQKNW